jgi:hypothetical protein
MTMIMLRHLFTYSIIAMLSGCAVMSKSDCLEGNWHRQGYKVGLEGDTDVQSAFSKRAELCVKHGEVADFNAFEEGHEQGIEAYCDVPNAVKLGARGASNVADDEVCPVVDYPAFKQAYAAGHKLYRLNRRVLEAQQELDSLNNAVYRNNQRSRSLASIARNSDLSDSELRRAQRQSRYLRRENSSIHDRIYQYQKILRQRERAAERYRELLEIEYGDLQ